MTNANGDRIKRLRRMVMILLLLLIFGAVAAPTAVVVVTNASDVRTQLAVTCAVFRSQVRNHDDLEDIRMTLGAHLRDRWSRWEPECHADIVEVFVVLNLRAEYGAGYGELGADIAGVRDDYHRRRSGDRTEDQQQQQKDRKSVV